MTFAGTPHNGPLALAGLGRTASAGQYAGYHLVGNPYPSPIAVTGAGGLLDPASSPSFEQQAWVFIDDQLGNGSGQYQTVNQLLNGNRVAVAQGFFVRTTVAGSTLTFGNGQRRGGGPPSFFRGELARFALSARGPGGHPDQLHLAFGEGFTWGHDAGWDGRKLDGTSGVGLSAVVGGGRYEVAALPELAGGQRFELPLQLYARSAGAYTFSAGGVDSPLGQKLFLEDRQTGEFHYLAPGRAHTVALQAGTHRDRFYLRASSEVAGQAQVGEAVQAYSFGRELFVEASETASVAVYDVLGVEVARFANVQPGGLRRLDARVPRSGVYVVRVATATETVEKRVWLEK